MPKEITTPTSVNSHNVEFGYELIAVLPFAYWLFTKGLLTETTSGTDTEPFYFFSPKHTINPERRSWAGTYTRAKEIPNIRIHQAQLDETMWTPPPLKARYLMDGPIPYINETILCICNRYTKEWLGEPVNYFDLDCLEKLFIALKDKYTIVYFNIEGRPELYDADAPIELGDYELCKKHGIKTIHDELEKKPGWSFNELQLKLLAACSHFITLNGGYSQLASYMGGTNIIYAKTTTVQGKLKPSELLPEVNSYYRWYHKFGGSRIVHVDSYEKLHQKVDSIYAEEQPLVNILIRTSGRPQFFQNCINSVYAQTYQNIRIIVGVDDDASRQYVQPHQCVMVQYDYSDHHVPKRPRSNEYGPRAVYNLYMNDLHKEVNDGYILYLDDDNVLANPHAIAVIAKHLQEDTLLMWRVKFPKQLIPSNQNFGGAPVPCDVDTGGFAFHHSHKTDWEPYRKGDYRVANTLYRSIPKHKYLDEVFVKVQKGLGFGKRRDLHAFTCPFCSADAELKLCGTAHPVLHNVIGGGRRKARCSNCGSNDRERLVWLYLQKYFQMRGSSILHLAPETRIANRLTDQRFDYHRGDLHPEKYLPGTHYMDILDLPFEDNRFDLIICNHVLEHIEDDATAMRQLYRVLKKGGEAILQVPLRSNQPTYENAAITQPMERLEHFGQADHVRIYGAKDYVLRLAKAGFTVDAKELHTKYPTAGLNPQEVLIIARK